RARETAPPSKKLRTPKNWVLFSQLYQFSGELNELLLLSVTLPVEPADLVVLAISVVIAVLSPAPLISAAKHRHALGQKQRRQKIPALPVAQGVYLRIIGGSFHAAIPRLIIVITVAIVVAVQLVVFFIVANQISQRKSVMRNDEVDARVWAPAA